MDLNLFGIILSAIAIIVNVVLARFGYLRLQLLWEVGYTPIAMFLSVWPLYTLGVIGPDAAIAFVLRDEIGEFFLSTVFPFVGAMASVILSVVAVIFLIYTGAFIIAFAKGWMDKVVSRGR